MLYNLSLPLLYPIFLLHQLCYIIFPSLYYIPYSCCINYVIIFPPFNLSLPFTISHILVASIMLYNLSLPLLYPIFLLHQLCYIIFPSLYYITYSCCINYSPPFTLSHILVASIMLYNPFPPFTIYPCCINLVASIMLYNLSLPLLYPIFLLHQLCYIIFPSLYYIPYFCFIISHILVASIMLYNFSLPLLYPIFLLHQLCYIIFPSLYYIPYSCCINYVI